MISLNDYIKIFSKPGRIFDSFGKIFDYGLQFSFSPGTRRNKGLTSGSTEGFILKGQFPISSRKGGGESFRAEGKFSERISMGELRV